MFNTDDEKLEYISERMKQFKLVDMRTNCRDLISEAKSQSMSYVDFLLSLIEIEASGKKSRRICKLKEEAKFEKVMYLEDIDYSFNHSLDKSRIDYLGKLEFIKNKENIIIIGPPGVGKSMIATGIGIKACEAGYSVLFVNAKEMIDMLHEQMLEGHFETILEKLRKVDLLIIDELSYIKMDKEKESLFFQLIRQRYESGSLIITTNLPIGRWNEIFTGQLAATAILDRLTHHCHFISITGDSYRVKGPKQSVKGKVSI